MVRRVVEHVGYATICGISFCAFFGSGPRAAGGPPAY